MEFEKCFGFKEELGDDEVSTSVNLLLQVLNVLLIGSAVWVAVRIP